MNPMRECMAVDLGVISYSAALELQRGLVAARKAGRISDVLLLCQHPHVITLGRNGKSAHLLASDHVLRQMDVEFFESDRGGDITYHGPGQLVGYPILNLAAIRRDVGWYMRQLEEVMIRAAGDFSVHAQRRAGLTGIWVEGTGDSEEKLGAIGVHLSRWVTSHGFAFNVSTDLRYFDLIVPCGLTGKQATSLELILGRSLSVAEVSHRVTAHFGEVFEMNLRPAALEDLEAVLPPRLAAPALETLRIAAQ